VRYYLPFASFCHILIFQGVRAAGGEDATLFREATAAACMPRSPMQPHLAAFSAFPSSASSSWFISISSFRRAERISTHLIPPLLEPAGFLLLCSYARAFTAFSLSTISRSSSKARASLPVGEEIIHLKLPVSNCPSYRKQLSPKSDANI